MNIISFGGGVQSTAMAILAAQKKIEVDAFVFCDTGFEQSDVFIFMEKFTIPLIKNSGIDFYIAKTEDISPKYYADMKLPPFFLLNQDGAIGRGSAYCSGNWKTDVFKRFCSEQFGSKKFDVMLGFSTDEKHRALNMAKKNASKRILTAFQDDVFGDGIDIKQTLKILSTKRKKWNYSFPLLDFEMSRDDCQKLVIDTFKNNAPRSSCKFCPNHTQDEWNHVMTGNDREWLVNFDKTLRIKNWFLTSDCKPIDEIKFDQKNETIFTRACSGGCFI